MSCCEQIDECRPVSPRTEHRVSESPVHLTHHILAMVFVVVAVNSLLAGEPKRLTHDGALKFSPVLVDGGKAVVYSAHDQPKRVSLMRLRLSDSHQELVDPSLKAHQFDADISADGRYLCFVLTFNSPQSILVIRDLKEKTKHSSGHKGHEALCAVQELHPTTGESCLHCPHPAGSRSRRWTHKARI